MTMHDERRQQTSIRPPATNRGRWWARHINLKLHDRPCEPHCPVCDELAGYQPDYSSPPPSALSTDLR